MVRIVAPDADSTCEQVVARIATLGEPADGPDLAEFARRYYAGVDDEDLAERGVDDLAAAALAQWRLARVRQPGEAIVAVRAPAHGHTVVDIVNDDMPFLVDSVTMALDRHDLGIHLVLHPILRVRRAPDGELRGAALDGSGESGSGAATLESWLHIEVDRET